MALERYNATMTFDTKQNHPDSKGEVGMVYSDIYTFNTDYFDTSGDALEDYIYSDMALVAGGGYDSDTIKNVELKIERV